MGTKIGYGITTFLWSLAGVATALVNTVAGFMIVRSALGLAEAGNFPSAIKTVAEWFPKKERALATGIFNSGANIGAIVTPITVPFIAAKWGWQWAFILTGLLGFVWLIFWFLYYEVPRKHKKISASELAFIESDKEEQKGRWR
jgi:ACS family hexuronate transporter-like MFS transporter